MEEKKIKYFLYIKESPLGLKYLGKTIKDPYKYKGSGLLWKRHLNKYGFLSSDIKTTIIYETYNKEELKKYGIFFSQKYDIVNDKTFANLIMEEGQGGKTIYLDNHPSKTFGDRVSKYWTEEKKIIASERMKKNNPTQYTEVKEKIKSAATGRKFSKESNSKKGKSGDLNVSKREDVKEKISNSLKGRKLSEETKEKIRKTLKEKKWQSIG